MPAPRSPVLPLLLALVATGITVATPPELSPEIRRAIWDREQVVMRLERELLPPLAEAFLKGDPLPWVAATTEDFEGTLPHLGDTPNIGLSFASGIGASATGTAKNLVAQSSLLWPDARGCTIRVRRLESRDDRGLRAQLLLQVTAASPPREWLCEFDAVISPTPEMEPWLHKLTSTSWRFARAPQPIFEDATAASGIDTEGLFDGWRPTDPAVPHTGGLYVEDLDDDGLPDLLVTDLNGTFLYRNLGDFRFEAKTAPWPHAPLQGANLGGILDLDGDGRFDLLLTDGSGMRLYRNLGGWEFEAITGATNLGDLIQAAAPRNTPSALVPADFDGDGRLDLLVLRTARRAPLTGRLWERDLADAAPNQLLRNLGNLQFEDVTEALGVGASSASSFAGAWFYEGADPFPDLVTLSEFGRATVLSRSSSEAPFVVRKLGEEGSGFGSMGLATGDFDGDSATDLFVASMFSKAGARVLSSLPRGSFPPGILDPLRRLADGSELFLAQPKGGFARDPRAGILRQIGWAWGASAADFDLDGRLDLYATAGFISRDRAKPDG